MNRPIDTLVKDLPIDNPMRTAAENSQDPNLKYCIVCKKYYEPVFSDREEAMAMGTPTEKEQWISGICSDECWCNFLGPEK
jgi:hypothetical protein